MPDTSDREHEREPLRRGERRQRRESRGQSGEPARPRRRRESHDEDAQPARRRQSAEPERPRRREPQTDKATHTTYDRQGRRRTGHRATDSSGNLLPKPSPAAGRRERPQSGTEQDSPASHKRQSRRNSTTDGSGSRARKSAPLSLDALAQLDKTNAKKAGWRGYDYDEEYLKDVRQKEKQMEKKRVIEEREKQKMEASRYEEQTAGEMRDKDRARVEEEKKARKRREEKRKAAAVAAAMGLGAATFDKTDDEGKRRSGHTDDEREDRRRRREAEYTPSHAEVKKEKRRMEKQHKMEMKKRRVISGPLAEEGGIDDDEYQYMMEKRGGGGSGPPTVYTADQLAKRKKWKRILVGVLSVLIVLAIIIPVAIMLSKKSNNDSSSASTSSSGVAQPKTSNLQGLDRNTVPQADRGGILDPWAWFDTEDFNVTYTNELVGGLPIIGLNMTWDDDVQANPSVPKLSDKFEYGKTPIRGVNVGGWLNLEPFITPSFFQNFGSRDNVVDEWTLMSKLGPTKAKSTLEQHYSTFITKKSFSDIRAAGMDHVRFPFGYWIVQTYDDDPYLAQVSWRYLLRGIEYCRQNGLRVNLDLHGAPGSQNGWNHSGRQGAIGWLNGPNGDRNAQRTLEIHHKLSVFFAQDRYKNVVTMYGLVNEPRNVDLNTAAVVSWTEKAVTQIRADGIKGIIVFGDGFMGLDNWQGKLQNIDNLLLDVHQYVIFNVDQLSLKHTDKVNFACSAWTQQAKRSMDRKTGFGPTMCGEWSQADTDCTQYINNVATGTRWDGTYDTGNASTSVLSPQCPLKSAACNCAQANANPADYSADYKKFLLQFGIAQMDAFEAGWGWFYWTWETEKATQWSYRRGREAGILPDKAYQRDWKCPADLRQLDGFAGLSEAF